MQADVKTTLCFYDTLLLIEDLLPYLVVFNSPQERSTVPITRTFDMNLHAKKPRTLVQGGEYF